MGCLCVLSRGAVAQSEVDVQSRLQQLREQNELLQQQLSKQANLIENLNRKVSALENSQVKGSTNIEQGLTPHPGPLASRGDAESTVPIRLPAEPSGGARFGKVSLSGEGGLAFFRSGAQGQFPNSEFRVDEAKLFLEAPIFSDIYLFTEINLFARESEFGDLKVGELYLDFENLSRFWNRERMLNLRVGRMDIPFGEEYLTRDAIDNPLISHSLSDLWGVDEGIELYGTVGKLQYALAVQNGGVSPGRDYDGDKSLAGRIGFDPAKWLHLSLSGMRTGDLDATGDGVSEIWFGNGWFRALDQSGETTAFHAELVEGDVHLRLPKGHIKGAGGYIHANENHPTTDNQRDIYYYSVEGLYELTRTFYGAARFSQILAANGYPLVGNGDFMRGFYGPLTKDLWRVSLGLGYRPSPNFLIKGEYSLDGGRTVSGEGRNHENLLAIEAAFKF
jgi:hypothetical protein